MKAVLLSTSLAALLATPALAEECQTRLDALSQEVKKSDVEYWRMASPTSREIRRLRNAALIFSRNGQDEACMEVVDGINRMLETRQAEFQQSDYEAWSETERSRIENAAPVATYAKSIHVSDAVGSEVRNTQNEPLGIIEEVVLEPGRSTRIKYVVISHDRFLGMGEEQSAIPWEELMVTTDDGERVYVIDASKERLSQAPRIESDDRSELDDPEWQKTNDEYYQQKLN